MMNIMIKKPLIINAPVIYAESHFYKLLENAACDACWQICIQSLGAK